MYFVIVIKGQFCMYAGSYLFVNLWNSLNVCSEKMSESFKILYNLNIGSVCVL